MVDRARWERPARAAGRPESFGKKKKKKKKLGQIQKTWFSIIAIDKSYILVSKTIAPNAPRSVWSYRFREQNEGIAYGSNGKPWFLSLTPFFFFFFAQTFRLAPSSQGGPLTGGQPACLLAHRSATQPLRNALRGGTIRDLYWSPFTKELLIAIQVSK